MRRSDLAWRTEVLERLEQDMHALRAANAEARSFGRSGAGGSSAADLGGAPEPQSSMARP